ncbi:MAG: peptidoglycan DD-metalloendopeptidase family protein [Elusimicrobiota bacterium]|jgi:septal ring factor EnvC (AmiA/AmiB activator)
MILLAAGLAGALLWVPAAAAAPAAESKRKELGPIQRELQETRRDIEAFRKAEQSARREADRLEAEADRARRRLSSVQGDLDRTESRRRDLRSRLGALKSAEGLWRSLLADEASRYMMDRMSGAAGFGPRSLWRDRLLRGAIVEKAALLTALGGAAAKTSRLEAAERESQRRLTGAQAKAAVEKRQKESEFLGKQAEAEGLKEKTRAAIGRAAELEESARALQRMIESITRLSRAASPSASIGAAKHSLPWPVEGKVLSRFGRQKDPKTGSPVISQGIRVEAAEGAPVRAVAAGSVIFAGPFRSYGLVLIVSHDGFFGVYGELGSALKKKGDRVAAGETLAAAGAGRLYFEVRSGLGATDPLLWLQER